MSEASGSSAQFSPANDSSVQLGDICKFNVAGGELWQHIGDHYSEAYAAKIMHDVLRTIAQVRKTCCLLLHDCRTLSPFSMGMAWRLPIEDLILCLRAAVSRARRGVAGREAGELPVCHRG